MKATITETGTLVVTPETALETFALKQWSDLAYAGVHTDETTGEAFSLVRGQYLIVGGNVPSA
ncbi:hypothetical protein [Cupriavidus gilardii]|uniref:hypothetical protein n=1 Tax=Cupriavidus gilardii TaxID=82541 RepID=UPI0021C0589D|nr:hypothetical protein [Cupriavidus gilardii]MCT9125405.1 hypothetical protein [Cupriavidus gilardii]